MDEDTIDIESKCHVLGLLHLVLCHILGLGGEDIEAGLRRRKTGAESTGFPDAGNRESGTEGIAGSAAGALRRRDGEGMGEALGFRDGRTSGRNLNCVRVVV